MSLPQRATPLMPIDSIWFTAELMPSKPQTVLGSPPQTTSAQRAVPVQPERRNRTSGRPKRVGHALEGAVVVGRVAVVRRVPGAPVVLADGRRRRLAEVLHPPVRAALDRLAHQVGVEAHGGGVGEVELGQRLLGEAERARAAHERRVGERLAQRAALEHARRRGARPNTDEYDAHSSGLK